MNYEKAIELLNSIGWNEQTQNVLIIIEKLKKDKDQFEKYQSQQKQTATEMSEKLIIEETKQTESELVK